METKERESHRKACRHYGALSGLCCKKSLYYSVGVLSIAYDIYCTPDCDCARMKRFDKLNKEK